MNSAGTCNSAGGIATSWNDWLEMKRRGWRTAWVATDELGQVSIGSVPPEGALKPEPELPAPNCVDDEPPEPGLQPLPNTPHERLRRGRPRPKGLPPQPDPEPPLTARLRVLQALAWRHPGKPASIRLSSGLRLDLVAEKSGAYRLLLARAGVAPSLIELAAVLNHWPDPAPDVTPEALEHQGWRCLKVSWQSQGDDLCDQ